MMALMVSSNERLCHQESHSLRQWKGVQSTFKNYSNMMTQAEDNHLVHLSDHSDIINQAIPQNGPDLVAPIISDIPGCHPHNKYHSSSGIHPHRDTTVISEVNIVITTNSELLPRNFPLQEN